MKSCQIVRQTEPQKTVIQQWSRVSIAGINGLLTEYQDGEIRSVAAVFDGPARFVVQFADGLEAEWTAPYFGVYNAQFGISVSRDGRLVFVQTWERGLFAYDSRTGATVWRTKSKRGISNIYINEKTVLCHQHDRALQLLNIETGEVLVEKRPATDRGFTVLKEGYILCRTRANKWEIIRTENLETVETIPSKRFPDCCLQDFWLSEDGRTLHYFGFKNAWDNSVNPPQMLPNQEFCGGIEIGCFD